MAYNQSEQTNKANQPADNKGTGKDAWNQNKTPDQKKTGMDAEARDTSKGQKGTC